MTSRTPRAVSSSTDRATRAAIGWAALVLAVAVWLSLDAGRSEDLRRVAAWVRAWAGGAHLYGAGSDVDYPPWAIVVLAPLAWVPAPLLTPAWIACNILCAALLARHLQRGPFGRPTGSAPFWLLMAAAAGRTLNQFSLPAMLAGTVALSGGALAWLWLGLALVKPQVGIVFVAWCACRGRWREVAAAAAVVMALTLLYAWVAGVPPFAVPAAYVTILSEQQAGLAGRTEVLWHLHRVMPVVPAVLLAACIGLGAGWPAWWRNDARGYAHLALGSLLAVRHQSYDLILLLPWVASLRGGWFVVAAGLVAVDPAALAARLEQLAGAQPWVSTWINPAVLMGLLAYLFSDNKRQERT